MQCSPLQIGVITTMLMAAVIASATDVSTESLTTVELSTMIESGDAPLILDVRTVDEFTAGHIPGAINIPHTELADRIAELDGHQNDEIVLHCKSGRRAGLAEPILVTGGFTQIRNLEGHWLQWQADNLPIETGVRLE